MSDEKERGGGVKPLGQLLAPIVRPLAKKRPAAEAALLTDFARRGALLTVTDVVCANGPHETGPVQEASAGPQG